MFSVLTHLNVSRNFLRRLPDAIGELKSLVKLNVSSNMMRRLTDLNLDALATLPALEEIDIRGILDIQKVNLDRLTRKAGPQLELLVAKLGPKVTCITTKRTGGATRSCKHARNCVIAYMQNSPNSPWFCRFRVHPSRSTRCGS